MSVYRDTTGWICPKCSVVYAPTIERCKACSPAKDSTEPVRYTFDFDDLRKCIPNTPFKRLPANPLVIS